MRYLDQLINLKNQNDIWRVVSFAAFAVIAIQAIAVICLAMQIVNNIDRVRYILAPGVQAFTTVRPGELPKSYIEESFRYVTDKLNAWSYESARDNYKTLFEHFYAHDLTIRTQANLNSMHYFEDIEERKLVSFWKIIPDESQFEWCGSVPARDEIKGVACGIITGEQSLFADYNVPVSKQKISYLVYAINVAPTPTNFFAIEVMRVKRGSLQTLRAELENSLKNGVLPPEEN